MKKLLSIFLIAFLFSCTKQQTEKTFGADKINETELDKVQVLVSSIAQYKRVKPPRNPPPTDTVVVPPTDTVVVPPPPVVIPPVTLPASVSLTMPPVANQGSEGSCVAFAITYARGSLSSTILSPEYLFNQTTTSLYCSGSAILTALNFLKTNGVCTWASMPYTWTGCTLMPTAAQTAEAANFRIASYSQILASDITAIKTMLANKRPLVCQVVADNEFLNATQGFVWRTFSSPIDGHAICVVGYDDAKQAFKIINSWGTQWGDSGYGWIDYNFLKTVSSSLIVMNL
jgi:uncharacterized protein YvpB